MSMGLNTFRLLFISVIFTKIGADLREKEKIFAKTSKYLRNIGLYAQILAKYCSFSDKIIFLQGQIFLSQGKYSTQAYTLLKYHKSALFQGKSRRYMGKITEYWRKYSSFAGK